MTRQWRATVVITHTGPIADEQYDEFLKHCKGTLLHSEKHGRLRVVWRLEESTMLRAVNEAVVDASAAYYRTFHTRPDVVSVKAETAEEAERMDLLNEEACS
jgi:hypothetical protein